MAVCSDATLHEVFLTGLCAKQQDADSIQTLTELSTNGSKVPEFELKQERGDCGVTGGCSPVHSLKPVTI